MAAGLSVECPSTYSKLFAPMLKLAKKTQEKTGIVVNVEVTPPPPPDIVYSVGSPLL